MRAIEKGMVAVALSLSLVFGFASTESFAMESKESIQKVPDKSQASVSEHSPDTSQPVVDTQPFLKHKAPKSIATGERMLIKAKISDKDGILLARVYFKTASGERYNFVVLNKSDRGIYSAKIPSVGGGVSAVDYKIVVQNALGEVFKSDKYSVPVKVMNGEQVAQNDGFIDVFSEYPEAQTDTAGFVDRVRYTYGVTQLVSSLGSSVSVASSGSGFVGGSASSTATSAAGSSAGTVASSGSAASTSAAGAATTTTTAATTSTAAATATTATAVSATTIAAVGAGAVGTAVAVSSASSDDDDSGTVSIACYTGSVVEVIANVSSSTSYYYGFEDGRPQDYAVYDEEEGCVNDASVDASIVDDTDYSNAFCYSEAYLQEIYNAPSRQELGQLSVSFGETLPCPTTSFTSSQ